MSASSPEVSTAAIATYGRDPGIRLTRAIIDTVDEIGRVVDDEQIDCGFVKGGVIRLARTPAQLDRQREEAELFGSCGFGDELSTLGAAEAAARLAAPGTLGGLHYRPCARDPSGSARPGLAAAVERLGGAIVERTSAAEFRPSARRTPAVVTDRGTVTADVVVRATEAYTRDLPGLRRALVRCIR